MQELRRRVMVMNVPHTEYVWIPLGSGGGGNNYNAVSSIDRTVPIYAIGFSTAKSRLANSDYSVFNRIGLGWEPNAVPLTRKTNYGHSYVDSAVINEGTNNSRIWLDAYDKRVGFRKTPGSTNSGWIAISNANFYTDTITLEDGNVVTAQIYYNNIASKLYSYDTSGPGPVYLVQAGSNVDMGYIYILIDKTVARNSFNWY